ncbi:WXG100 family type VII secretion target [Lentzea sp. NBRC 102530]|uniref:WXG100 family type VII secretion target n=1 Tax=Lentzea sp. NBRC 102530 TaxID=3032201 RepID=UPI0024A1FC07|nr:WXG100 family type VII secretion target [Lentzea sp. NBRC 102530]MDX3663771.1 WXG100 family type VII secretion target [Streptomyces sp. ID05-26A]GLY54511.1 hypothetical protein Lesp01_81660 [Lentzea sp. NBRC 102530]
MTTYTFNRAQADAFCQHMATVSKQLRDELERMDAQVQKLLYDWSDGAKLSYVSAKQQWDAAAARMPMTLESVKGALNDIGVQYAMTERNGMKRWGS